MTMIGLRLEARYHWGYWIRTPYTSKYQCSLLIPPPTTLIGALCCSLIREGVLRYNGTRFCGEVLVEKRRSGGKRLVSPSILLERALIAASAYLKGRGVSYDDVGKYVTVLYQARTRFEEEEKEVGGRRYLMKYRSGAIQTGKIYYPSGEIVVLYVFDEEKIKNLVDGDPASALEEAGWRITRIGSKESIVSILDVKVVDTEFLDEDTVRTKYYFPTDAAKRVNGSYYTETFWSGGWGRDVRAEYREFIVPGRRIPISSEEIEVEPLGKVIRVGNEILLMGG